MSCRSALSCAVVLCLVGPLLFGCGDSRPNLPLATSTASSGGGAAGGGGGTGAGGFGGGGASVGTPLKLSDDGLVARYFLAEADSGQGPQWALDSSSDALDLGLRYAPDVVSAPPLPYEEAMSYVEREAGRRGWHLPAVHGLGGAYVAIEDTKLYAKLNGTKELTLEFVGTVLDASDKGSRLIHFGVESGHTLGLETASAEAIHLAFNNKLVLAAALGDWSRMRLVVHGVIDTAQSHAVDRVRLYVNGQRVVGVQIGTEVEQHAVLALEKEAIFMVANRFALDGQAGKARSIQGDVNYAAVYNQAFDSVRAWAHHRRLIANDDPAISNEDG